MAFGLPCEVVLFLLQDSCPNACGADNTLNLSHHRGLDLRVLGKVLLTLNAAWSLGEHSRPLLDEAPKVVLPPQKEEAHWTDANFIAIGQASFMHSLIHTTHIYKHLLCACTNIYQAVISSRKDNKTR